MAVNAFDVTYQTANDLLSSFPLSLPIKNAVQLYVGYFVDLEAASGTLIPHVAGAASVVVGFVMLPGNPGNDPNIYPPANPNTVMPIGNTVTNPDAPVAALVEAGSLILQALTTTQITGGAGTQADVGKKVWAADASTLTMTDPGTGEKPVGVVERIDLAETTYDVLLGAYSGRKV